MPRINQLPVAASVAQTDVLAIDTPDKTYQVPRSVLAPSPYIATIPTGQWSGSGSDYYITVTASNVTADSILYPFFDSASEALLTGSVWAVPASGSFTIHTSAIPAGTVTISVLLAGVVGEAQYQVLSDVYSKSQVDFIVAQSTAKTTEDVQSAFLTSKVTFTDAYLRKSGKFAEIYLAGTANSAISAWESIVTELPSAFRPYQSNEAFVINIGSAIYPANLNSSGVVNTPHAISNGQMVRFHAVYMLQS